MRTTLRIFALTLLIAPFVAPAFAETPQTATPPPADARVALEDLLAPVQSVAAEEACSAPDSQVAEASYCPYGGPDCVEHDDCDDFCGSPEFGYCEKQGFFPTGCCLCLG